MDIFVAQAHPIMKKSLTIMLGALASLVCAAQRPQLPPPPENVVHSFRNYLPAADDSRSYNMAPVFFVYPDGRLDKAGAEKLVEDLGMADAAKGNHWSVFVVNPVGEKYEAGKDFEAFKQLFNAQYTVTNLKVVGIGAGATFVNQVLAKDAGAIAGILTVGGKPAKEKSYPYPVPVMVAGKGAAKAAKPYQATNRPLEAAEPLLKTVVTTETALKPLFQKAWDEVFSRNYRFNNEGHTWYEGSKYGEFGVYELEPYMIPEHFGVERRIITQEHAGTKDWLWYEYFPEGTLDAPAKSVPLMVLLHGNTNDPRTQAETSGFIELAGEEKFVVAELEWQGSDAHGAMGHDGIESVIYQLLDKYPQLDPSRIYAEGLSAGSITSTALGIKKSHLFTAVGGHSGGIFAVARFCEENALLDEATQKSGFVEMPYCSVLGSADKVVPFIAPDDYKGNGYLKAWNVYEKMNGVPVVSELNFNVDPVFGFALSNRQRIVTAKGNNITVETGEVLKGDIPVVKIIAVMNYGHWNFKPTARMMWDYFSQFSRDPQTKRLIYHPAQ